MSDEDKARRRREERKKLLELLNSYGEGAPYNPETEEARRESERDQEIERKQATRARYRGRRRSLRADPSSRARTGRRPGALTRPPRQAKISLSQPRILLRSACAHRYPRWSTAGRGDALQ